MPSSQTWSIEEKLEIMWATMRDRNKEERDLWCTKKCSVEHSLSFFFILKAITLEDKGEMCFWCLECGGKDTGEELKLFKCTNFNMCTHYGSSINRNADISKGSSEIHVGRCSHRNARAARL